MVFPIRVNDVMSAPVITVEGETSVAEAAREFGERAIGSLVIVDDREVVGIVTTTDLIDVLGREDRPGELILEDIMSRSVIGIEPSATVGDAVHRMREHGIQRLVVREDGRLVGIVTSEDVLRYVPQVFQREYAPSPAPEGPQYRFRHETAYEDDEWEFDCVGCSTEGVSVGDWVRFSKRIDESDVRAFAAASGDTNRLHLDEGYASKTRFGRRIVHGTLVGGLISAALARLPGVTIYLSQDLTFLSPVGIGERVTATCEVIEDLGRQKYQLTTDVVDEEDDQIIEGQAVVLIDEAPDPQAVTVEAIEAAG